MGNGRIEKDSFGPIEVPAARLWGAQTQRSLEHFRISGERMPAEIIEALAWIKRASATVNASLQGLAADKAQAIVQAADEVLAGRWNDEFPLVVWQTGSGTQSNMNMNEVLANRASELMGGPRGEGRLVHPNDDVNRGQSSNDVFPTAMHVAAMVAIRRRLLPPLAALQATLEAKAREFDGIVKIGRTHLQDATPLTLGQEFSGYAAQLGHARRHVESTLAHLSELALGGTAVGTGINCPPGFAARAIARISEATGLAYREAADHFEAQGARDAALEASGQLRTVAVSLFKIASDVRLLASGPRGGLGEIVLPALQPGSSIMPGKVNPVLCEVLTQVCAQVIGNDAAIAVGGLSGQLELNVFMPLVARNLLESIRLLANATRLFAERCVAGIVPDPVRAESWIEGSLAMVTALAPRIGYDAASALAKEAFETGRSVRQLAKERAVLPAEELERLLDPRRQTEGGI